MKKIRCDNCQKGYRKQCECCGKKIKIKSKNDNSTKYCDKCKHIKQLEWSKKSYYKSLET